ncbi:MAG: hypothetical protein HRU70_06230 [Phycisphaeraceae bacterium]|nr:MAG: hypothetical protein HRU70_06230 [Phycisphaeraceae bacterium]
MTRDTRVQAIAVVVLAACLALSAALSVGLTTSASRHKLTYTTDAEEGQPPQVALGIAMGAFRGVFVNMLWIRANDMKEAGRHYEAVELAKAITALQPRFPRAWSFHAWNLAYNISVKTQTRSERWQWVRAGIELIRQQGLKYNPNDLLLSKELGWIFLHKVQGITDDANIYYKKMHALEWQIVLGTPPRFDPTIRSREAATARFVSWLEPIASAPLTLEGVFAGAGGDGVRALVAALRSAGVEENLGIDFLRLYERVQARPRAAVTLGLDPASARGRLEAKESALRDLVEDTAHAGAWPALLAYVRGRVLCEDYRMDAGVMIRYTRKYGPLDWRHPAAHALYWSALGVENALTRVSARNTSDFDFVNTDRIVIQAVQELYRTGTVFFDAATTFDEPERADYLATVEPNFVDTYGQILDELRERSPFDNMAKRGWTMYSHGYENFLKDVVRFYFRRGQLDLAEKYRQRLITFEGQSLNDPFRNVELTVRLEQFVRNELVDRQSSPSVAISEVEGALQGAFEALILGDAEMFRTQFTYAQDFWNYFKSKQHRFTGVNPDDPRMAVLNRDFPTHAGIVMAVFCRTIPITFAPSVWNGAPPDLQRAAYDPLRTLFAREITDRTPLIRDSVFDQVFVEPPGMAAYRAQRAAREGVRRPEVQAQ